MNSANINQYWTTFNESTAEIRQLYARTVSNQCYDDIAELKLKINQLQEFASISTSMLPVYDIKRSQHVSPIWTHAWFCYLI